MKWTQEETEYIAEMWGHKSVNEMARKLGRSAEAIKGKGKKMGLGHHLDSSEMITFRQFILAIGCPSGSYAWYRERWKKHGFPIHRKAFIKKKFHMVSIEEFWKWAEAHQDIIDFSNFERYALGKEPDWVEEKRSRVRSSTGTRGRGAIQRTTGSGTCWTRSGTTWMKSQRPPGESRAPSANGS